MRGDRARFAGFAAVVAVACLTPAAAGAKTITVDSPDGGATDNGNCALPEAIVAANDDQRVDECKRGDGKDLIAFDFPGSSVVQPNPQLPDITAPVTIDGTTEPDFVNLPLVQIQQSVAATGVEISADHVTIKGLQILDFSFEGIRVNGDRNKIVGNLIGLTAIDQDHGNGVGVTLNGDRNKVGGKSASARNVISGNGAGGGVLADGDANRVQGNYVGTTVNGNNPRPNDATGIRATGDHTKVMGNVVSGNAGGGVRLDGNEAQVRGNIVGLGANGSSFVANDDGIDVFGKDCTIGGPRPAHRNVISGNGNQGILLGGDETAARNRVLGNYIGTDVTGTLDRGNDVDGVRILGSDRNVVGGDEANEANVISGNFVGVRIGGTGQTARNAVSGNTLGTDPEGVEDIGNESGAVRLTTGAHDNMVGGLGSGEGNLMVNTPGGAVSIGGGAPSVGNSILGNSAFENGEEVIDLAEEGITPNDPSPDADTGPNHLQNFPVLSGANEQTDFIAGELDSAPQTRFRIEYFTSPDLADAKRFVGAKTVKTNGAGHTNVNFNSSKNLPAFEYVTATATVLDGDDPGDTSELSASADISIGP